MRFLTASSFIVTVISFGVLLTCKYVILLSTFGGKENVSVQEIAWIVVSEVHKFSI